MLDLAIANYAIIYEALDLFVPKYTIKKSNFPVWFSSTLKMKVIEKKIAHKKYKATGNHHHYVVFRNLRYECDVLSNECYRNYVANVEERLKENGAEFWKFVRNRKSSGHSIPDCMFFDNQQMEGGKDIVNMFSDHFSSVYSGFCGTPVVDEDSGIDYFNGVVDNIEINFQGLLDTLLTLNVHKVAGPDLLPNMFLRECPVSM